ncbi:acyltransferase [Bacillus sp. NP157]|nr:acyltransferase [Bacillus sp. NP157]
MGAILAGLRATASDGWTHGANRRPSLAIVTPNRLDTDIMATPRPYPDAHHLAYRPGIDGMRAIAVLGVVLYHAGFGPPGGFVGVDVFFVISGFLITSLLTLEHANTGRIDLTAFYARRVRRLLPALGVVLLTTLAASAMLLSPTGAMPSMLRSAAASAVFGANIFFQYTTGDYFGPDTSQLPLLHLWSLGVEEQFYLAWPIALIATYALPRRVRVALFAVAAIASFVFVEIALAHGSTSAFYAMPSRWWELAAGALVAWTPGASKRAATVVQWFGIAFVALALGVPLHPFPGTGALPAVIGAALLLYGSASDGPVAGMLSSRAFVAVGRISYPLYLWHWPLLALAAVAIPGQSGPLFRAELVAAALLLAAATQRWVERPVQARPLARSRRMVGATLLACLATAFALAQAADLVASNASPDDLASRIERDTPPLALTCERRSYDPVELPDASRCALGGKGPVNVAIWGDSHAMSMQPVAAAIAARGNGKTAMAYARELCPPALGYDNGEAARVVALCRSSNEATLSAMQGMDTVILAARWPDPATRGFGDDLLATFDRLSPSVRRIIVIGATPTLPARPPQCVRAHDLAACTQKQGEFRASTAAIRTLLASLPARYPNVTYIEPTPFFCDKVDCPPIRDGIGLYFDRDHVTVSGATAFARSVLMMTRAADL